MRGLKVWAAAILILTANMFATPFALSNQGSPHKFASQPLITPLATSAPKYVVSLDANSVSQSDVSLASSASQSKSFRIGAVINSTGTNPLKEVYAWQFGIVYNASAFIPQGDPGSSLYPDGAVNTVLPGGQTTPGAVNWAAKVAANQGLIGSRICQLDQCATTPISPPYDEILVFFTLLNPSPNVTISANNLLANVNFELVAKPGTAQIFNITDVAFANQKSLPISGPVPGLPAFETITNAPPIASFTAATDPTLSPTAFIFNGSLSHDLDGTIANPGGYFWDLGDGTQSLGVNGSIVTHDYGVNGSFVVTLRVQDNGGATGSARDLSGTIISNIQPSHSSMIIGPQADLPPTARFTFRLSANSSYVVFDGTSSTDLDGRITSYQWLFGDGSNQTVPLPYASHDYRHNGNFTVALTVVDNANLTDTTSHIVPMNLNHRQPIANFTFSPTNPTANSVVFFNATGSRDPDGFIVYYGWNFGDGVTYFSRGNPNATNVYSYPGTYTVTLTVTNNVGFSTSISKVVRVVGVNDEHPTAVFSWYEQPPSNNNTDIVFVGTFSNDPDGYILAWNWSFGNGGSLSGSYPDALVGYNIGNYTVTLTVTDSAGLTASVTHIVTVKPTASDEPPSAQLTWSPLTPRTGSPVLFNANASSDPDGSIQSFFWLFDDGSSAYGPQVSHIYYTPGAHTAILTITDSSGISTAATAQLQVQPGQPPTAQFTYTPLNPTSGSQVFFDGTSSSDPDGSIQLWAWNFGDGFTSTGPQVYHSYSSSGSYNVTLTVTDSSSLTATVSAVVLILPDELPTVNILFAPHNVTDGQRVFFNGNATDPDGFIQSWSWYFGDGQSWCCSQYTYHDYNGPGNYTVTLTVTDSDRMVATATTIVTVHPRPLHDVAITQVYAYPQVAVSSQLVSVQIGLTNNGSSNETVTVTAYYGTNVIGTLNVHLPAHCYYCSNSVYVQILWDTTGVPAGNYTISATVPLLGDPTPADNTMRDGNLQVLPAPALAVSPSSGPDGTTVLLTGTNFPGSPYRSTIGYVEVTYDDQLVGFTNSINGQFNFTLSIPLSQSGQHWIKAIDQYSGAHARVAFQVLPTPLPTGNLSVTLQVGTLYFSSDTAVIYAQVSFNGVLTRPASLQLILFRPDGSNITLTTQTMGVGLYKASYNVPRTGSIGTYLVIAKAHTSTLLDASQGTSFEVKQSWIQQGGPAIAGGVTTATLVGLVVFVWKKGYLRKKEEDPFSMP